MRLKLIACNVFQREACHVLADTPHVVDPDFLDLGAHIHPARLRNLMQERIEAADNATIPYEAVVLLYGLCGNAVVGLRAGCARLVIPRAHDCATLLLGSRSRFADIFGECPSRPFLSAGYLERGSESVRPPGSHSADEASTYEAWVEQYGEDNAQYLWQTLYEPQDDLPTLFIDTPPVRHADLEPRLAATPRNDGRPIERIEGNLRLIRQAIHGDWPEADFLHVPPGQRIEGVWDAETVLRAAE